MDKTRIYAAAIAAFGMIVAGIMIPQAVKVNRSFDRTVSVKGLCEREVKADKAIWPLIVKVGGNDLQGVLAEVQAKNGIVRQFLEKGGIKADEITSAISINDKNTLEYNSDRAQRYIAKSVITVCTQNVDAVLALMAAQNELMAQGVTFADDWENKTQFSFEGLNGIKPEMIEEATRNAREAAEKFAKDSDSRLGKIKTASQGTFSITDRDSNTPQIKNIRVVTSITYQLSR